MRNGFAPAAVSRPFKSSPSSCWIGRPWKSEALAGAPTTKVQDRLDDDTDPGLHQHP